MLLICSESTASPMRAISCLLASTMASASVCCSRMIASTVMLPMMLRRCPEKIRPTRVGICPWSPWNRRAAEAIDSWSSPTLNAITACTARVSPCLVKQSSTTSASCMARLSREDREKIGVTNTPCPVTILNCRASAPCCFLPLMSKASLGLGTWYPNIATSLSPGLRRSAGLGPLPRIWPVSLIQAGASSGLAPVLPRLHLELARPTHADDQHLRPGRDGRRAVGEVVVRQTGHHDANLARQFAAADPRGHRPDLADQIGLVHRPPSGRRRLGGLRAAGRATASVAAAFWSKDRITAPFYRIRARSSGTARVARVRACCRGGWPPSVADGGGPVLGQHQFG